MSAEKEIIERSAEMKPQNEEGAVPSTNAQVNNEPMADQSAVQNETEEQFQGFQEQKQQNSPYQNSYGRYSNDRKEENSSHSYKRRRSGSREEKQQEDDSTTFVQLYVAKIERKCQAEDLRERFVEFGPIDKIEMKGNYAFIYFETHEGAVAAIEQMNGKEFQGKKIVVQKAQPLNHRKRQSGPQNNDECWHCGKRGHWANECRSKGQGGGRGGRSPPRENYGQNRFDNRDGQRGERWERRDGGRRHSGQHEERGRQSSNQSGENRNNFRSNRYRSRSPRRDYDRQPRDRYQRDRVDRGDRRDFRENRGDRGSRREGRRSRSPANRSRSGSRGSYDRRGPKDDGRSTQLQQGLCFNCNQKGHIRNNCPEFGGSRERGMDRRRDNRDYRPRGGDRGGRGGRDRRGYSPRQQQSRSRSPRSPHQPRGGEARENGYQGRKDQGEHHRQPEGRRRNYSPESRSRSPRGGRNFNQGNDRE